MFDFDSEAVRTLCRAILTLETEAECRAFLEDICTITELQDMTQRLTAARLLSEGSNYQNISEKLGLSTATIARVNRCLNYGTGGYRTVLERMKDSGSVVENK